MKTPRNYQHVAIQRARRKNLLLADECGLGKTLVGIEASKPSLQDGGRILIICPLRLRSQWLDEIIDQDPGARIVTLEYGIPPQIYGHPEGWFITSYEAARDGAADLSAYLWDWIIIDEAHRIKNRKAKQTTAIKHIPAIHKIGLTGTPMEKNPGDLWSILHWLHPDVYTSYWSFYNKYVERIFVGPPGRQWPIERGLKNVERLAKLLEPVMLRRTKEEVAPELPPKIIQRVKIQLNGAQREDYDVMERSKDILVNIRGEEIIVKNELSKIVKLQEITSKEGAKTGWFTDWLGDNPDTPVVAFTKFRATAYHLYKSLEPRADLVMGGVQELPHEFLNGTKDILVGTIAAMGEGLNLQRAEVAVFIDQEWSTTKMTQAYDRIHRMNITGPKLIYLLTAEDTVDELVVKALDRKWTQQELVYEAHNRWKQLPV